MSSYEKFFQLHHQQDPFIIANVWNVKSARIAEKSGFSAIATSSGAIADSLGYPDGEKIPFEELFYIIRRIRSCTDIPLSVDLETGYTNDLTQLNAHIQQLTDIGVVGINLEDTQGEEIYLKKLNSINNYLSRNDLDLFINARTDGFLQKLDQPLERTLTRAGLYADAGADGLFVTGIQDTEIIKKITAAVKLPVNIVGLPSLSAAGILAECGVKRISMAVFMYRATYDQLEKTAKNIVSTQSTAPLYPA